jgi:hypothetical protein
MMPWITFGGPVAACMAGGAYLGFSFFGPIGGAVGGVIGAIFGITSIMAVNYGKEKRSKNNGNGKKPD